MFILADDLTGAADTGVAFAARGMRTVLQIGLHDPLAATAVTVVSSNSRDMPVDVAIARVQASLAQASLPVYKKIDSVFRGYVAAELVATMEMLGIDRALVAPAFPAQGRITQNGQQLVHGQPVLVSLIDDLRAHTILPMRIIELRSNQVDADGLRAALHLPGIVIADAETDEHLDQIADIGQQAGVGIWCGSAGLAHALARRTHPQVVARPLVPDGPTLIVVGSYHDKTRQQLAHLHTHGCLEVALSADLHDIGRQCVAQLMLSQSVALVRPDAAFDSQQSATIARMLGDATRYILMESLVRPKLLLTGGDTALAVCAALGTTAIELSHELEPGVPLGQIVGGVAKRTWIITKSGGFGDNDTLWRVISTPSRPLLV